MTVWFQALWTLLLTGSGLVDGSPFADRLSSLKSWVSSTRLVSKEEHSTNETHTDKKDWFSVDPAALLSNLIEKGGLFLPSYVDDDLHVLRQCLHCEHAQLNIWTRDLVLTNFTIGLKQQQKQDDEKKAVMKRQRRQKQEVATVTTEATPSPPALLRIGRVAVSWDSYSDPVLSIEVDDVDVSVEFTNLMLTESNWKQLNDIGFPPLFLPPNGTESQETETNDTSYDYDSWIRVASVDVAGNVTVRVSSRPLNRDLGVLSYDMRALRGISKAMKKQSRANFLDTGRLGLTVSDFATLLQNYFLDQAQDYVMKNWQDLVASATDPQETATMVREGLDQLLDQASDSVVDYALEATENYARTVQDQVETSEWGSKLKGWFNTMNKTADKLLK